MSGLTAEIAITDTQEIITTTLLFEIQTYTIPFLILTITTTTILL